MKSGGGERRIKTAIRRFLWVLHSTRVTRYLDELRLTIESSICTRHCLQGAGARSMTAQCATAWGCRPELWLEA